MNTTSSLDGVTIERFTVAGSSHRLSQLVECYRSVFAGHPWNEWKKCSVCGRKWGIDEKPSSGEDIVHCSRTTEDYWPATVVETDIRHEIVEGTSCWIAVKDGKVIGFCWGYPVSPDSLESKLKLPAVAAKLRQAFPGKERLAYQDELGVAHEYRGKGLAKALYRARHQDFMANSLEVGVVRTKRTPPSVTYSWFTAIGYEVIAEYLDTDDRVILARDVTSLELG